MTSLDRRNDVHRGGVTAHSQVPGTTALVTGASQGLGRGIAIALSQAPSDSTQPDA